MMNQYTMEARASMKMRAYSAGASSLYTEVASTARVMSSVMLTNLRAGW